MLFFQMSFYPHPVANSDGMISYVFKDFPCPESKSWEVLNKALSISIPRLCENIANDPSSSEQLKERATNLYEDWISTEIPTYKAMDEANKEIALIVVKDGWMKAAEAMCKGRTYAEMRELYG